jgi:Ca-activated chloride channel family protein
MQLFNLTLSPESSRFNVVVTEGIAHVRLTQLYVNRFSFPLADLVYVFPLPEQSSVHAMSMEYQNRYYTAEILEKQSAQQIYDSLVSSGYNTALLLQDKPNIFQQQLANIASTDSAWIEIELSVPHKFESNTYELTLPTMARTLARNLMVTDGGHGEPRVIPVQARIVEKSTT